ncbi:MAG: biotin synthase BioB [Bacteroidetes bacterium]|nr:biotin synthase BioB [Bacteroidota bacterium]MCL2329459.1 biotin synthase BioB [Bacteroidota bacterium]
MFSIQQICKEIKSGTKISFETACKLANHSNKQELYNAANEIREHFCGNSFHLCSITNAKSGLCSENCKWCSQSAHNTSNIEIYDCIDTNVAVEQAVANGKAGVHRHALVTSGRSVSPQTLNACIEIFNEISQKSPIALCASMGLLSKEQLLLLQKAGVKRYHCNLETAPSFFSQLCTTHTIDEKIETIRTAQSIGMEVCSGGIIGMGETMEQRIELAFALHDLNIVSIPLNILNPIQGTPLYGTPPLSDDEILTTIAMFRLINPKAYLRFAGGRLAIQHIQEKALHTGINASITGDYLTTNGANITDDIRNFATAGFCIT